MKCETSCWLKKRRPRSWQAVYWQQSQYDCKQGIWAPGGPGLRYTRCLWTWQKSDWGSFYPNSDRSGMSQQQPGNGHCDGWLLQQVTMTRKHFFDIPDILSSRGRRILVIVEGRRSQCWSYGVVGHLAKVCPDKNPAPTLATPSAPAAPKETVGAEKSEQISSDSNEWTDVVRRGKTLAVPPLQQDIPTKEPGKQQLSEQQQKQ